MSRPPWDFAYAPVALPADRDAPEPCDLVVATRDPVPAATLAEALRPRLPDVHVETVLARAPLHWFRVRASGELRRSEAEATLLDARVAVRWVAPAGRPVPDVVRAADCAGAPVATARAWPADDGSVAVDDDVSGGRWFLGPTGVRVTRRHVGTGAGVRLAVIDDDSGGVEALAPDAVVHVGIDAAPAASCHGAFVAGWAVGTRAFRGVAPGASLRVYLTAKPEAAALALPLAIVAAVDDGADVVVCATHLDHGGSPMLDDALELAFRLGRGGRGAVVVLPTGRELSSPRDSIHASLALSLDAPASDPRVVCVAPSGSDGRWFLWRDRRGRRRPFGNRGPAVRFLAPGDDMADPLDPGRTRHAESSGAAAVAGGVVALLLATDPTLAARDAIELLRRTCAPAEPVDRDGVADVADILPRAADADGHDARSGYGRLDATAACLAATDPLAAALVAIGERRAAARFASLRKSDPAIAGAYSARLARWAAQVALRDPAVFHALSVLARHFRLLTQASERLACHPEGASTRYVAKLLALLARSTAGVADPAAFDELTNLIERARSATHAADAGLASDRALFAAARAAFDEEQRAHAPGIAEAIAMAG